MCVRVSSGTWSVGEDNRLGVNVLVSSGLCQIWTHGTESGYSCVRLPVFLSCAQTETEEAETIFHTDFIQKKEDGQNGCINQKTWWTYWVWIEPENCPFMSVQLIEV